MTLSSGAGLKKVKAQAGKSKSFQALKRRVKAVNTTADAEQPLTKKSVDDHQASSCSAGDQQQTSADTPASDVQPALVDHTGLADVLSSAAGTAFDFPLYTNPPPAASPYRQRLEEIQHRRAESERLQRALASNSHLQLVVFCHRNDAYNFLPDGASITDMGAEQNASENLLTAQATVSQARQPQSTAEDDVSQVSSDTLLKTTSVEDGPPISTRKKQSRKHGRAAAKKSETTLEASTGHTQSQGPSLAESRTVTAKEHNAARLPSAHPVNCGNASKGNMTPLGTQKESSSIRRRSQDAAEELVEASGAASWDEQPSFSAHMPTAAANHPCSSPLLSPQDPITGRGKRKSGQGVSRMGSTPSSSRPSSRISGTTDASEASELDLGQFLLSSQALAAVASRSVTEATTKAQRRRAKMKQSSRVFEAQNTQEQGSLHDGKYTGDHLGTAERTHQVRRLHIGPLPQVSPETSRQRPSFTANTQGPSRAPTTSSMPRTQGKVRTSSSASSSQPPSATSWKVKGTSDDSPNRLRSYATDTAAGQLIKTHVSGAKTDKEPIQIVKPTSPMVVLSGSSSTGTDTTETRNRSIPGASHTILVSNKDVTLSASKPQREKERIRLARERKQQELHRQRIAEAVAAAERGEKLSVLSQEVQRDADTSRSKKTRPVVSVPPRDDKSTESTVTAEILEGCSPRSRESAISKAETDDSYHTAASNIRSSSPAPKSPREGSESSCQRHSDEGEPKDSSSVHSTAPSILFSPLSTGSATITCFSPLQTPLPVDAPQRPQWYPEVEDVQATRRPSLSKHVFSPGTRRHSPSTTVTTDTSEVTGSQYGPSPPSDSSIDFGDPQPSAVTEKWHRMQTNTGADLTSGKLHVLPSAATPFNEDSEVSLEANGHPAGRSDVSSSAPPDKPASSLQHIHTAHSRSELLPSVCSNKPQWPGTGEQRSTLVTTQQNFTNEYCLPAATASPPSSLTVIADPLDSNGVEHSDHIERPCHARLCPDGTNNAGQSLSLPTVSRTTPQALPLRGPPPAPSPLPTPTSDLKDPQQLSAFRRCVSELNAFEDDHQRRSRAREERLARLHCYDLEGFVETKRTIVETDGPSKGRTRIVRLWRTHSMLAPGRRLSAKFDFDPSISVTASRGSHRPTKGTAVLRAHGKGNAAPLCLPKGNLPIGQSALVGSSSLPDNLSRLLAGHQRPAFTPHCDIPLLACDTSESNVSRASGVPDSVTEYDSSLSGVRVIRPSGLVRSILEDASLSYSTRFEDTTESVLKSGSTYFDVRPDLEWLDSLQSLDESERAALRCFLRAQEGESGQLPGTDCPERGGDASEQVSLTVPVTQDRTFTVYPTMGHVTGPNGQQIVENDWAPMTSQLRRSASNLPSATIWHPEPPLQYETATSAMSSPHGSLFVVDGQQAPYFERYYSSSPHLPPMSSHTRPVRRARQTTATVNRAHSRALDTGSAWSPVPPPAQSYYSDGSEAAHNAGPTSPQTEPEAQMEALVAAVQRCLSADGGTSLPDDHSERAWPSQPPSDDLASLYASSSAGGDRASSAGESALRKQEWSASDPNSARRHVPSRPTVTPYGQQQHEQSTTSADVWRDGPSSIRASQERGGLEHSARSPQRQRDSSTGWQSPELQQRSHRIYLDRASSATRQHQARALSTQGRDAFPLPQPAGTSAFAPSSVWYAQPDDALRDLQQQHAQAHNELPRSHSTYPQNLLSPAAGPKSSPQAPGMVSNYVGSYRGTHVDGPPLDRIGGAPSREWNHAYTEDRNGRLTSTYGQRPYDSTQELQNESRRAVQQEAAMLYAHGSRSQAARSVVSPGRSGRPEVDQASRSDEHYLSRLSPSHQLSSVEHQSRSGIYGTPSDEAVHSRCSSSPRSERSSSRSDVQSYNAARPGDARTAASIAPSHVQVSSAKVQYNLGPDRTSDRGDLNIDATQHGQQQGHLYYQQRCDADARSTSSYETRAYSTDRSTPSAPYQDEDQTVRIDRGRVPRRRPSQEQQFRAAHHQQASVQQAQLPPRPSGGRVDASSAWDEPQRPEANTSGSQQQRPQQARSSANEARQRSPYEHAQGSDVTSNRREQQPHTSYEASQRGSMRSDGHAQRGGGGRGRPYRGGWKQYRWEDSQQTGHDRSSGSAGTTVAEHTAHANTGHGGRGGGETGSGSRGRGAPNRLSQR